MKPKHFPALGVLLAVIAGAPLTASQNPAPAQTTEQQKLKDRLDALESRQKADEEKADRAAFEKDRIESIQKEAKDYYDKAFASVSKFVDWLIILAAALPVAAGLFSFGIIDRFIRYEVSKATDQFDRKAAELKTLIDSNAAHMKQAQDDIMLRSSYAFELNQGQIQEGAQKYTAALARYRNAVHVYESSKPRQLFVKEIGPQVLQMTFSTIEKLDPTNFQQVAKNELANELYDDLEEELAQAALQLQWLAPLLRDRKPASPAAQPATAQESPAPAPKKPDPAKPDESENK